MSSSSLPFLSLPLPPSSAGDVSGSEHYYKWRCHNLEKEVASSLGKRKKDKVSMKRLGHGIPKAVSLFLGVDEVVRQSDKHQLLLIGELDDAKFAGMTTKAIGNLKHDWARLNTAFKELVQLIPNFQKKIDNDEPAQLQLFYAELQHGGNAAHGDDIGNMMHSVAIWVNEAFPGAHPLLNPDDHEMPPCGIKHPVTGHLLCPVKYKWEDKEIRAKLQGSAPGFEYFGNFLLHCLFEDPENTIQSEQGFLKSSLLVKVFKFIFTLLKSAKTVNIQDPNDSDNAEGTSNKALRTAGGRRKGHCSVAETLQMTHVTPRALAYAAVQLILALSAIKQWTDNIHGLDLKLFYEFIIDYFEEIPAANTTCQEKVRSFLTGGITSIILMLGRQIFPGVVSAASSNAKDEASRGVGIVVLIAVYAICS
ncbi:unnamed protein product [Cyclocybe aegerita]|uniref:Uncharacterized protein n=1 Tax=Cyclocybe aegerita TaxID=1973307 RepID=A0A8S0VUI7_CYCAE|nr:unnamed protein product [Cyclocybe aegerita]